MRVRFEVRVSSHIQTRPCHHEPGPKHTLRFCGRLRLRRLADTQFAIPTSGPPRRAHLALAYGPGAVLILLIGLASGPGTRGETARSDHHTMFQARSGAHPAVSWTP